MTSPAMMLLVLVLGASEPVLVDEVVATVDRQVITRSEVMQEAVLILVERFGPKALERRMTPEFLEQVLQLLVNQRVLTQEALRLGLPPVRTEQRRRLLQGFRNRFADEEQYLRFLYGHDLTEEAIAEVLARHLWIEMLKKRKLRSLPEISERQLREYYQRHRLQLGGKPLEMVAEAIRLKLLTEQRQKYLSRWLWQLRRQSRVRILVRFANTEADE